MKDTVQICATIRKDVSKGVNQIVKDEKRSFSQMVDILLEEALRERKKKTTKP